MNDKSKCRGETISLAGYAFTFEQLQNTQGKNYQSITATFSVTQNQHPIDHIQAEQRIYLSHEETLSKPGILANPWRDLYLALGIPLTDGSWSVRLYYKPLVRWVWLGGFMLLASGLLLAISSWKRK